MMKPRTIKRGRANPEARLQISVKQYLTLCLPDGVWWTASLAGHGKMTPAARNKAKAMGLKPGWPDLQFLLPDGRVTFIELKSETGSLSPEQRAFRDAAAPHGIHAVCRSIDEVEATLRGWGVKLRNHPFGEGRAAA
jgi:hypothetical protein